MFDHGAKLEQLTRDALDGGGGGHLCCLTPVHTTGEQTCTSVCWWFPPKCYVCWHHTTGLNCTCNLPYCWLTTDMFLILSCCLIMSPSVALQCVTLLSVCEPSRRPTKTPLRLPDTSHLHAMMKAATATATSACSCVRQLEAEGRGGGAAGAHIH